MRYREMKRIIAKTLTAGLLASLVLGWAPYRASAAPVITNMPHRADGTRITGSQPVPRKMPGDVAVKAKPQNPESAAAPGVNQAPAVQTVPKTDAPKPATPAAQPAPKAETPEPATAPVQTASKTDAPKPATLPAQVKPATPAVQTATPKAEAPKPATPAAQPAPKAETSKPATPVQIKPAVQTEPKPAVKAEPAKLPTKPPGLEKRNRMPL